MIASKIDHALSLGRVAAALQITCLIIQFFIFIACVALFLAMTAVYRALASFGAWLRGLFVACFVPSGAGWWRV